MRMGCLEAKLELAIRTLLTLNLYYLKLFINRLVITTRNVLPLGINRGKRFIYEYIFVLNHQTAYREDLP